MQSAIKADGPNMSGHILIKQFINNNRSVESILSLCERLEKDGHTQLGLYIAVEFSFHHGNIDMTMELLRAFKEKGQPIRNHFFWPSLCTAGKVNDRKTMNNILKRMVEEFDVSPSSDTIRDFYLPFVKSSSVNETLGALLESGVRRGPAVKALVSFLITENKLSQAAELAYQHPKMNVRPQFVHRTLSEALAQTKDVKSVVGLVHVMSTRPLSVADSVEDGEDAVNSSEDMCSRFLTNVVSNSSTRDMVAAVLKEMVTLGLQISNRCAEVVENQLQGNQLTTEISDMLAKLSSGELTPTAIKSPSFEGGKPIARNPPFLERIKDKILANNESTENLININRSLFQAYCYENDLDNALRIKKVWTDELKQELTAGMWAQLLACHCSKNDLEGAKECLNQINAANQDTVELDATKIVRVAKLYVENNQIDEALNLLKNMKPREEDNSFHTKAACYQTLNSIAESTKDPEQVKRVFQTLLDKKYVDVSNVQLGPIIKAYLLNDDIAGALKEFETCVKKYRATPWKNELAARLIEKEDAANLQTLVDLSTIVHGEINSLYDLVLSFVECGRIRQARKILETPGLIMRNTRLQAACERYKSENRVEPLEGLVEATKDLPNINRSDIYYQLLQTYCQADNVDKALGLWTQMQEENVQVSDEFLVKLGSFLQSKGLKVPFSIPKLQNVVDDTPQKEEKKKTSELPRKRTQPSAFNSAVYAKNVDNALSIKERMEKSGEELTRSEVTRLIELLIEKKRFEDVTNVLVSLEDAKLPAMRTLNYAVSRLSMAGEMELLKRVGDRLSEELKKVTSFSNRYINCAVIAGKGKDELEKLEKQIDNAATTEEVDELATSFPFGGIFALLNSSPVHLEPVTRIAEKYYSRGVVTPVNCLCMFYLAEEQYDKARELYQHYNLNNASRLMFQHALGSARNKENPKILEELMSLITNSPTFTNEVQGLLYSNLVNIYEKKGDLETALGKLEEALRTLPIEAIHTSTLVQLKTSLEAKNIPFKYTIPPRQKSKDSSTSSSSSDEEPKQSMAAKH